MDTATFTPLEEIMSTLGADIGFTGTNLTDRSKIYGGDSPSQAFIEGMIKQLGYRTDCAIPDHYWFKNYSNEKTAIHAQITSIGMCSASSAHDGYMVAVSLQPMKTQFGKNNQFLAERFTHWVYLTDINTITELHNLLTGEDSRTAHWREG